jgi:septum formation protein
MKGIADEWILASASPRRRQLLAALGHPFRCVVPQVDEWEPDEADAVEQVCENATRKGREVAKRYPCRLVIAADTTVALGRRLFAKPADGADARRMLRALSGRTHRVVTAVCLCADDTLQLFYEVSDVRFRDLSDADIAAYIRDVEVLDKAGAYAIQDGGERIVECYSGSFENIMGLPMQRLREQLVQCGWQAPAD